VGEDGPEEELTHALLLPEEHEEGDDEGEEERGEESQWERCDDPDQTWPVEEVLGYRQGPDGAAYYLVKWLGWDTSWNTWEPAEHFVDSVHVERYWKGLEDEARREASVARRTPTEDEAHQGVVGDDGGSPPAQ